MGKMRDRRLRDVAWAKAILVKDLGVDDYRMDSRGAWIRKQDFNNPDSPFGWRVERLEIRHDEASTFRRTEHRATNIANVVLEAGEHNQYRAKVRASQVSGLQRLLAKLAPQMVIKNSPCDMLFELKGKRVIVVPSEHKEETGVQPAEHVVVRDVGRPAF